ncbi:hypothetical protein ACS0TY_006880 [Phlomoides rotata]
MSLYSIYLLQNCPQTSDNYNLQLCRGVDEDDCLNKSFIVICVYAFVYGCTDIAISVFLSLGFLGLHISILIHRGIMDDEVELFGVFHKLE